MGCAGFRKRNNHGFPNRKRTENDQLNLIAVKAAKANGGSTSTDAVHLVAAQLSKSLFFGDDLVLLHRTLSARKAGLVVFRDGNGKTPQTSTSPLSLP